MTIGEFSKVIKDNNIPEEAVMLSDSGWECGPSCMDGIYYSEVKNEIVITQAGDEDDRYYAKEEWRLLHSILMTKKESEDTITLPEEEKCKEYTKLRQDKEFERSIETSFLFGTAFGFASKYDEKDKILKDIREIIDRGGT